MYVCLSCFCFLYCTCFTYLVNSALPSLLTFCFFPQSPPVRPFVCVIPSHMHYLCIVIVCVGLFNIHKVILGKESESFEAVSFPHCVCVCVHMYCTSLYTPEADFGHQQSYQYQLPVWNSVVLFVICHISSVSFPVYLVLVLLPISPFLYSSLSPPLFLSLSLSLSLHLSLSLSLLLSGLWEHWLLSLFSL